MVPESDPRTMNESLPGVGVVVQLILWVSDLSIKKNYGLSWVYRCTFIVESLENVPAIPNSTLEYASGVYRYL